jgi:hypothetical protein
VSNRAHHRRRKGVTGDDIDLASALMAKVAGCTCDPEATRRHQSGTWNVQVRHDPGCPALRTARQVAVVVRSRGRG